MEERGQRNEIIFEQLKFLFSRTIVIYFIPKSLNNDFDVHSRFRRTTATMEVATARTMRAGAASGKRTSGTSLTKHHRLRLTYKLNDHCVTIKRNRQGGHCGRPNPLKLQQYINQISFKCKFVSHKLLFEHSG